jgi:peptidoglycan/xylan/chitin deacetylase (PgdA/CDA1 family)
MKEQEGETRQNARRKRVKRLKKIIVGTILSAIILPMVLCVVLFVKLSEAREQLAVLEKTVATLLAQPADDPQSSIIEASIFSTTQLEESDRMTPIEPMAQEVSGEEPADNQSIRLYLTFDDGPSSNTNAILDILKQYDVRATFFVIGKTDEQSLQAYRRIVEEGHTLGMHSYSHSYQEIYGSEEQFAEDLTKLQEFLYEETGVWCRYYRFPGGSSNKVSTVEMQALIDYLDRQDIIYYDWNVGSGDAASGVLEAGSIVDNCLNGLAGKNSGIILMHDSAQKGVTVEALPLVIEAILATDNTVLLPIDDDTPLIQHLINGVEP